MFYENLKKLVKERNTTITAVCKELKLSTSNPYSWKNGVMPNMTTLIMLAQYFGIPTEDLIANPSIPRAGKRVPVYGCVRAGIPAEAIQDITDYEDIDAAMSAKGEYMALTIKGDSMEPMLREGDVVIILLTPDIKSGDIVIALVNGEDSTCKRFEKTDGGIILTPINPEYKPIFYSNRKIAELPVRIYGKVVELRRKF